MLVRAFLFLAAMLSVSCGFCVSLFFARKSNRFVHFGAETRAVKVVSVAEKSII
jgi:hypothetical protein